MLWPEPGLLLIQIYPHVSKVMCAVYEFITRDEEAADNRIYRFYTSARVPLAKLSLLYNTGLTDTHIYNCVCLYMYLCICMHWQLIITHKGRKHAYSTQTDRQTGGPADGLTDTRIHTQHKHSHAHELYTRTHICARTRTHTRPYSEKDLVKIYFYQQHATGVMFLPELTCYWWYHNVSFSRWRMRIIQNVVFISFAWKQFIHAIGCLITVRTLSVLLFVYRYQLLCNTVCQSHTAWDWLYVGWLGDGRNQ